MIDDLRQYHRSHRAQAIADGRCSTCRKKDSKPVPGKVNCQPCLDASKLQRKWARYEAIRVGLCGKCLKRDARDGKRSCQECADALKAQPVRLEAAE